MVLFERRQQRSHGKAKPSILGDGLLERARSTSLALLGVTAAVGLGMAALALNQGWPLIAGSPIPGFGPKPEAVGAAVVAARAGADDGGALRSSTALLGSKASSRPQGQGGGGTAVPAGSVPPGAKGILVSHSTPAGDPEGGSPDDAALSPSPVADQPAAAPVPASNPVAPPAGSVPQSTSEPAASSPQPVLASHESDGQGSAHPHYSGANQGGGSGRYQGDDDHSRVDAHSPQGYGHAKGESGSDPSRSPTESVSTPSPPPSPVSEPATAEGQGGTQSYIPAAGHGSGHAYGHDHGHW